MFFIHPPYHRKGIGRALFDFAMQEHPYWKPVGGIKSTKYLCMKGCAYR
jgi:GNAT superfamily N-acetyltransferase